MQTMKTRALVRLSESTTTLKHLDEDIRNRPVTNLDGDEIGKVDDLFLDQDTGKVRFLIVGQGGILGVGKKHFLIPVDAITTVDRHAIRVNLTADRAKLMPEFDETRGEPNFESVYSWWGYEPFWTPNYREPEYLTPAGQRPS